MLWNTHCNKKESTVDTCNNLYEFQKSMLNKRIQIQRINIADFYLCDILEKANNTDQKQISDMVQGKKVNYKKG